MWGGERDKTGHVQDPGSSQLNIQQPDVIGENVEMLTFLTQISSGNAMSAAAAAAAVAAAAANANTGKDASRAANCHYKNSAGFSSI